MVPADSYGIPRAPYYSGFNQARVPIFSYGTITLCGWTFQNNSPNWYFSDLPIGLSPDQDWPYNPWYAKPTGLTHIKFRLFPVRSSLLGESLLFSLPGVTKIFQFTPFPLLTLCIQARVFRHDPERVAPFGNLRIKSCLRLPEAYRSLPRPSSTPCPKASTVRP